MHHLFGEKFSELKNMCWGENTPNSVNCNNSVSVECVYDRFDQELQQLRAADLKI